MTAPIIPLKFVKTLNASGTLSQTEAGRWFMKALYEFWGFCINGGTSTTTPGGFAAVSGVIAPAGFESGSTTLLANGADGKTDFGTRLFHSDSTNFISMNPGGQVIGKYLVTWKPDSDSTDDSIYPIIGIVDANTINVNVEVGGTRRLGNKAFFRKREGIRFRVVDILAATKLSNWNDGDGLVLQFNRASDVNTGQAASQAKISLRSSQQNVGIIVSPSGSWSGTSFSVGEGLSEVTSTQWYSNFYFGPANPFIGLVMIGGRDFIMVNSKTIDPYTSTLSSGFHIEIPKRLYRQDRDPNPVAFNLWGQLTPSQLSTTYASFKMMSEDNVMRPYVTLARSPWGEVVDTAVTAVSGGMWQNFSQTLASNRYVNFNYNQFTDSFITSDAVLGCNAPGHFNIARARLRRVRFTSSNQVVGFRYGDLGWVYVANGVLWPWDNSQQAFGIQPEGL